MAGTLRYLNYDALTEGGVLAAFPGSVEAVSRVSELDDLERLAAGTLRVDLMAVFGPYVEHYTRPLGVLQPIDVGRLSNWQELAPEWRCAEPFCVDGVHLAVPNNWGTDSLIIRNDRGIDDDDLALLFDADDGLRLAMPGQDGIETTAVAGMYLGIDDPFAPSDVELRAIADLLRAQRRHVVRYWETEKELVAAFAADEVDAAWGWRPTCVELRRRDVDVRWGRPVEGEILWADGNGIAANTELTDQAYEFLDFLLSTEYLQALYRTTGYRTCSTAVTASMSQAERTELELDDTAPLLARCVRWVSPPPARQTLIAQSWHEATR